MSPRGRTEVAATLAVVAASVALASLAAHLVDPGQPGVRRLVWLLVNSVALMIGIPYTRSHR